MERSGVLVFICGNNGREVLADWLIASRATFEKNRSGGNQGDRSREQIYFCVHTLFGQFHYKKLNCSRLKKTAIDLAFAVCINGPLTITIVRTEGTSTHEHLCISIHVGYSSYIAGIVCKINVSER